MFAFTTIIYGCRFLWKYTYSSKVTQRSSLLATQDRFNRYEALAAAIVDLMMTIMAMPEVENVR